MTDVSDYFAEYKEAYPAATRARSWTQVSGRDRAELAALIDAFLERSAAAGVLDPEAFRASPAAAVAESVQRSLAGSSGMWPSLLPRCGTGRG